MSEAPSFNPLHEKYPELHKSPDVAKAVERHADHTGERLHQPTEKLNAWMQTLEKIHVGRDEDVSERIKEIYHKRYVMSPDKVPEAYFELQRRIAREQGHGDIDIPPQVRQEMADTISRDQERSLDAWVDYLSSKDAPYPMWFKYYTFRNVTKLADFDKEKQEFKKRSSSTTGPFPDINREALSYVADVMARHYSLPAVTQEPAEIDPKTKQLLDQDASFAKIYAHAIEKIHPASQEDLAVTDGQWVKYDQGTDGLTLAQTLQGHGTGWCTAGEGTAQAQLDQGDFYVYYTKAHDGAYSVPRVAIRMQQGQIAEVRGIQADQNLESALVDIARNKMSDLPGAKSYEKKVHDMQTLTTIEKKVLAGPVLAQEELRFLYEVDSPIEGFGYDKDPRIDQLKSSRNVVEDFAKIFDTTVDKITMSQYKLTDDSVALLGNLDLKSFSGGLHYLPHLRYIGGYVYLDGASYLDQFTAYRLLELGQGKSVAYNLDKFEGLNHSEIADRLIEQGQCESVASNLDKFEGLNHLDIAKRLMEKGYAENVARNLANFEGLTAEIADLLIELGQGASVAYNLDKFEGLNHSEIADRLIEVGEVEGILFYLYKFEGLNHSEIANRLIEKGFGNSVAYYLHNLEGLSAETADRLIEAGYGNSVAANLHKFEDPDGVIHERLIRQGFGSYLAK